MSVGVFVVTHNHGATLAATLEGLSQQGQLVARVVLVDNNSSDESLAVARSFEGKLPLSVLPLPENTGFSRAANLALAQLETPWVLSLNPDCRLLPGFLSELLAAVQGQRQVGSACGLLLRAEGPNLLPTDRVDSAGMVVSAFGRHHDRGAGKPLREAWTQPAWVFGATGACALYRREALQDVAYPPGEVFDEGFFAYREDADLAWRLQRRGWRCLFWPAARAVHGRGLKPEEGRAGQAAINLHSVKNRFLLRLANADWRWHVGCFPFWLFRDLLVIAACLTLERSSLAAFGLVRRLWPQYRKRGRENAARARVSSWRLLPWFYPPWQTRRFKPCG
ncbi:N-acetylglucosaminyl-diphospho-decaprenol L-rhamnosyltransferase [bacterium HR09]|nr:N-acetylglucosaminyl-diphospho-decaprenol L-rhamnosyltransferase [bacterium HR09]